MSASILTNKVRHRPWSGGRKAAAMVGAIRWWPAPQETTATLIISATV